MNTDLKLPKLSIGRPRLEASLFLPLEIWRLISYNLVPYSLACNLTLISLYDDNWFEVLLMKKYKNLWYRSTYKDLYKNSLRMGTISLVNTLIDDYDFITLSNPIELPIQGIKVSTIGENLAAVLILDFNGNLHGIQDFEQVELIDSKVIDIDNYGFIKARNWYYLDVNNNIYCRVPIKVSASFIKVSSHRQNDNLHLYALTKDHLHIYDPILNTTFDVGFDDAIDMYIDNSVIVLQSDGEIFEVKFGAISKTLLFKNGKELRGQTMVTIDNKCYRRNKGIFDILYNEKITLTDKFYSGSLIGLSLYKGVLSSKLANNKWKPIKSDKIKDIYPDRGSFYIIQ